MLKARRDNVVLRINNVDVQHYINKGYDIYENGKLINKSTPTTVEQLQTIVDEYIKKNAELELAIDKLKAENEELKKAVEDKQAKKKTSKKEAE